MKALQWLMLILFLIGMFSCSRNSGVTVIGSSQLASTSHTACLSIVRDQSQANGGAPENYLYLMIICPDIKKSDVRGFSSGVNGNPMSKPEIDYSWTTQQGDTEIHVHCNTGSETLLIGDNKFSRTNGNVFTVVRGSEGKLEVKQCGTLQSHADYKEAVQFIRERCASDKIVSTVKFYKIDE